ncbi:MAG: hypothetical protein CMO26_24075 [Thiotrichales bacterium]|nr:hypothetical protein [Thiotrichales bacterium]
MTGQTIWRLATTLLIVLALAFGWAGINYELPSRDRVESLAGNRPLDPNLLRTAEDQRDDCASSVYAQRSRLGEQAKWEKVDVTCRAARQGGVISNAEKQAAFRSHLLRGGWSDEGATFSPLSRMRPSSFDFDPGFFVYGGAYLYFTGALIFLADRLGFAPIGRDVGSFISNPNGVANIYRSGRSSSLLTSVLSLVVLSLLALHWGDWRAATLVIGFYAFTEVVWAQSYIAKPHSMATFWSLLCFYVLSKALDKKDRSVLIALAGAFAGLSIGSALTSGLLVLTFPIILYEHAQPRRMIRSLALAGAACVIAFIASNPYALINYGGFLQSVWQHGVGIERAVPTPGRLADGLVRIASFAPWWLMLLGVAGLIFMLRHPRRELRRFSAGVLLVGLATTAFLAEVRFVMFCIWLIPLGFGLLMSDLAGRISGSWRVTLNVVLAVLILPSILTIGFASHILWNGRERPHAIDEWARSTYFENVTVATIGNHFAPAPAYPVHRATTIDMYTLQCLPLAPDWIYLPDAGTREWQEAALRAGYTVYASLPALRPLNPFSSLGLSNQFEFPGMMLLRRYEEPPNLCIN